MDARFDHVARFVLALLATALLCGMALSAITAAAAHAQQPAICDEYPDLPECALDEDEDEDEDEDVDDGFGPGAGPSAGAGKGELPFTGYPLTPFILVLLLLLLAAMVARAGAEISKRRASARAGRAP